MYLWLCSVAVVFGLISGFPDLGFTIQTVFCALLFFLSRSRVSTDILHEISTQTDQLPEDTQRKDAEDDLHTADEVDTVNTDQELPQEVLCPNVKKSLQKVFECMYSQFVLSWYSAPEPREGQPLHKALERELDLLADRIILTARDVEVSSVGVDCVRVLTHHLHTAKQPGRTQPLHSRADDMKFLRVFSQALVHNLFPTSLATQDLTRCALIEIVALKGLEPLVNWLSDPDNLNQLVVSQLDGMTLSVPMDDLQEPKREDTLTSLGSGDIDIIEDFTKDSQTSDVKPKKKGKKIKEKFSNFFRKKNKNKEEKNVPEFRALLIDALQTEEEEEAFFSQNQHETNSDDSDVDPPTVQEDMIEFKLSYEVWRISTWAVSVRQVLEDSDESELSFTIHLEEVNSPEKLQWDVQKTQTDIREFHSNLQGCGNLPSLSELLESTERTIDAEFKQEARDSLETFLQELLRDRQQGQSLEVFQFLCPLERLLTGMEPNGGVWSFLSGLAYILTPAPEEDEEVGGAESEGPAKPEDEQADLGSSCRALLRPPPSPGGPPAGSTDDTQEDVPGFQAASLPVSDPSDDRASVRAASSSQDHRGLQCDSIDGPPFSFGIKTNNPLNKISAGIQNKRLKSQTSGGRAQRRTESEPNKKQVNQEEQEATKAIINLLKEISGNSLLVNIVDTILKPMMPLVKRKVNSFLKKMNPTEGQMASYIDRLREKLWPGGVPAVSGPDRTSEQKSETKERALQLINTKCSNFFLLKKSDGETVFKIFQDTQENKKLVYMLLSLLLRRLMPREVSLNV
ncbi:hypothetical protein AGOR_G00068810 [Albula goreensis]|uniref:PXA domain-containing protein n=1 Tax=Albula goreensis TaxID=1534307 RepID=A0A8T3DV02_9TELE|nr:hypothetical protein AGOR_G00068810 [Albula goreensis]